MKASKPVVALLLFLCCFGSTLFAQQLEPVSKIKKCLFKGTWQLFQTYSLGSLHAIKKDEYDELMQIRSMHRFRQEVNYESNQWVIEGRWKISRKNKTISFTQRNYTSGKLEDHPRDLTFSIIQLNKQNWGGSNTEKDQTVKIFYQKVKTSK